MYYFIDDFILINVNLKFEVLCMRLYNRTFFDIKIINSVCGLKYVI